MDIEELNKTQFLLLTLLVNFVTSIAVCVMTVSLIDDQAPTITQTVNRIVERTVETVATAPSMPSVPGTPAKPAATEEELRAAAISGANARTVGIYRNKTFVAVGTYLPKSKAVVTAAGVLPTDVSILFPDGTTAEASRSKSGGGLVIYGFADSAVLPTAPATNMVALADTASGHTVIAIMADRSAVTGMVTKVDGAGVTTTFSGVPAGTAIVNLAGNIVGISQGTAVFVPAEAVSNLLSAS